MAKIIQIIAYPGEGKEMQIYDRTLPGFRSSRSYDGEGSNWTSRADAEDKLAALRAKFPHYLAMLIDEREIQDY